MRTDIQALEHACDMIHTHVDLLPFALKTQFTHLETLNACIAAGRYLHPDTTEARNLASDAETLRRLALLIEESRAVLVANVPAQLLAAE